MRAKRSTRLWAALGLGLPAALTRAAAADPAVAGHGRWSPRALTPREARRLRKRLAGHEFDFLGGWHSNASRLLELSELLVGGGLAVVEDFLAPEVAETVLEDTLRGLSYGWQRPLGTPLNGTGLDLEAYRRAASPSARCGVLAALDDRVGFKFQFHVLDPRGHATPRAGEFQGHMRLFAALAAESWPELLAQLLTGSKSAARGASFELPYYRKFVAGDYALLHNDVGGGAGERALCLNFWLPTPGWKPEWGGGFLWCGPPGADRSYPGARRVPVAPNTASLFVPHPDAWHAVDLVEGPAGVDEHRFSFTSWLEVPRAARGEL